MHIYIPTRDRVDKQRTWDNLPLEWRRKTTLVCPENEVDIHKTMGRNVVGCNVEGIALTRDWIVQHAYYEARNSTHILMLDDDLKIQRRRSDGRITDTSEEECSAALNWIDNTLFEVKHAGFGPRFLGYNIPGAYSENVRMLYSLGYDLTALIDGGFQFSKGMTQPAAMEDFNMTLQLLSAGYSNRVSLEWRLSNLASNLSGGCSTWRTSEIQTRSAKELQTIFPHVVKLRQKKIWDGMEGEMLDVTVQWKKALNGIVR